MMSNLRRKERALPQELALAILTQETYGILATSNPQDGPLATPLNYVFMDHRIYFHAAQEGHKMSNLLADPRVSFCVVGAARILPQIHATAYVSVVVHGTASLVRGEEKHRALQALIHHLAGSTEGEITNPVPLDCPGDREQETAVVRIDIEAMTGKGSHLEALPPIVQGATVVSTEDLNPIETQNTVRI